ncbi:MAG: hypothetical protein Q8P50_05935, partial [Bacillota bacterium]|nr:hypothetical protein [Bacillota bacterium]
MNILERLGNLDRRWWFLVLAVIVALPIVKPMGLPTSVGDWAKQTKETLDLVQPGDKVLFSCSYSAGGGPDVHPGAQVLFKILLNKGAKVILVSFTPQGDSFAEQICREAEAAGAKYGTDFVNLGFIAGAETAVATYAANPSGVFSNDFRGNPVSELPAYQGVTTAADFGLTVLVCTGMPGVEEWTRQITNPYKVPAIICVNTNGATRSVPYLQSGQIQGL